MTAKPAGSGLGLTICRQIVEHFGGRIWVEPALPRGAAFRFTLPLGDAVPTEVPAAAAAGED
jgi:signal transduction histidine kinase